MNVYVLSVSLLFLSSCTKSSSKIASDIASLTQEDTKEIAYVPKFQPGDCVGENVSTFEVEEWEKKPHVEVKWRIEQIGKSKYRVRQAEKYLNGDYQLLDVKRPNDDLSYTTFKYVDDKYAMATCPPEMAAIPLGSSVQKEPSK